jgi:S-adenosylmethionine:tRNA ribosyltransferase-isomerase
MTNFKSKNFFEKTLAAFDYHLPKELIAQAPQKPRDSARLLTYHRQTGQVVLSRFTDLANQLPPKAVLVFNETKVLPARFAVTRITGGRVKLLYLAFHHQRVEALCERRLHKGEKLFLSKNIFFTVKDKIGSVYILRSPLTRSALWRYLARRGETPTPPYLRHSTLVGANLRQAYQSVFAKRQGSAAAPTASLHFTKRLLRKLKVRGFEIKFLTLHVGLGTFAPLTQTNFDRKQLHGEPYVIDPKTAAFLNRAKQAGRPIVAVGTTVTRALESAVVGGRLKKLAGMTQLFLCENDKLKFVDCLITNFHVPRSSLMMLVSAFIGRRRLIQLYHLAIKKRFRFFSFGDGMLIR